MPTSANVTATPQKRRKGEITAERILDAAEDLFSRRGYAGTSLRDVGNTVGIQIASLYNHFQNKDALYAAVLERNLRPAVEALGAYVAPAEGGVESARELAERMNGVLFDHPRLPALIQHEALTGGERLTSALSSWLAPIFASADDIVETSLPESRWDRDELRLLVLAVYHLMIGYFTVAPLYKSIDGTDLLSAEMLKKQTRIVGDVVEMLFGRGGR
jgi:AcrR family transcriptional regulator